MKRNFLLYGIWFVQTMFCFSIETIHNNPLLDFIQPQYCLYQIEHIADQIINDIDVLKKSNQSLVCQAVDNEYVMHEVSRLSSMVHHLIDEESKRYHYLPDDIQYLLDTMKKVEDYLMHTQPQFCTKGLEDFATMCNAIAETKSLLRTFLIENAEILL